MNTLRVLSANYADFGRADADVAADFVSEFIDKRPTTPPFGPIRYPHILPIPTTQLSRSGEVPPNANYICDELGIVHPDLRRNARFIMCEAPMPESFALHWQTIWEHSCTTSVVLARIGIEASASSDQYWPNLGQRCIYGEIAITCEREHEATPGVLVHEFTLEKGGCCRTHRLHYYSRWRDGGIPDSVDSFLELYNVAQRSASGGAPVVVHCSAGVGRSGVYVAFALGIEKMRTGQKAELAKLCRLVRRQRHPGAIFTVEQYVFLHQALSYVVCHPERIDSGLERAEIASIEEAHESLLYGGKASHLALLVRLGANVPRGFVLSALAARRVASGEHEAVSELTRRLNSLSGAVAVRSSAIGEDSSSASFAGQLATVLNIPNTQIDEVVQAIARVSASGETVGSRRYRDRMGIEGRLFVAVVIQEMIEAECSGVLYTCDPLTSLDQRLIEASWGSAHSVVASLIIPDFIRMKRGGEQVEMRIGRKDWRIDLLPTGTVNSVPLRDLRAFTPCLDSAQCQQLDALATLCESNLMGPLDIEWAFAQGRLFALQLRPVCVHAPDA